MPPKPQKMLSRVLSVINVVWHSPEVHVFTLSDGRQAHARWEMLNNKWFLLNLGDKAGACTQVLNAVPKPMLDKYRADEAKWHKAQALLHEEEGEDEEMEGTKFAAETARRAKLWGFDRGKHVPLEIKTTAPLVKEPDPKLHLDKRVAKQVRKVYDKAKQKAKRQLPKPVKKSKPKRKKGRR